MATTEKTWEQQAWDDLPEDMCKLFDKASVNDLMSTIVTGFIALSHKTGHDITYCVGTCYMSLLQETKPEFMASAIEAAEKIFSADEGMADLLTKLDD